VIANELQPTLGGVEALAVFASPRMPTDRPWCTTQTPVESIAKLCKIPWQMARTHMMISSM